MNAAGRGPAGEGSDGARGRDATQNIATAIAEVSERATLLVREEIELAKAEMTEKATKLVKGAVVGIAAGVFFVTALVFALVGCAWLLYYYLPVGSDFTYFWGFFAMAVILVVLGVLAGVIAARAVKKNSPPVPNMALEEARKIRESVGSPPPAAAVAPLAGAGPRAPASPPTEVGPSGELGPPAEVGTPAEVAPPVEPGPAAGPQSEVGPQSEMGPQTWAGAQPSGPAAPVDDAGEGADAGSEAHEPREAPGSAAADAETQS